jgi:hypothetical protein
MRFTLSTLFGLAVSAAVFAADKPTAEEQKAIDAIEKAGGTATIDPKLHPDARVAAKFETVTDAVLLALKKLPQVGEIDAFDAEKCTEKGFASLKDLPHLRKLVLGKSNLNPAAVAAIGQCQDLRHLGLPDAGLTDAELAALKKLTLLEHLSLNGNPKITDKGMQTVKGFERLRSLYLANTGLTDRGLAELKGLDGLRTLNVVNTKVTADAAEKFADDMPNLRGVRR